MRVKIALGYNETQQRTAYQRLKQTQQAQDRYEAWIAERTNTEERERKELMVAQRKAKEEEESEEEWREIKAYLRDLPSSDDIAGTSSAYRSEELWFEDKARGYYASSPALRRAHISLASHRSNDVPSSQWIMEMKEAWEARIVACERVQEEARIFVQSTEPNEWDYDDEHDDADSETSDEYRRRSHGPVIYSMDSEDEKGFDALAIREHEEETDAYELAHYQEMAEAWMKP